MTQCRLSLCVFLQYCVALLIHRSISEAACPEGWFGPQCDKLLHCNKTFGYRNRKCVKCQDGWFGQDCQYSDIVLTAGVRREELHIIRHESAIVKLSFDVPIFFTWLELYPEGGTDHFTTYPTFFGSDGDLTCENKRTLDRREERKVIVRCQQHVIVTSIIFNLTTVSEFNNIHVSGGVNFSLKKPVLSGKNSKEPDNDPKRVVDGDSKTCARFNTSRSRLPYFTVLFPEPMFLQRINIHGTLSSKLDINVTIHYGREVDQLDNPTYKYIGDNMYEYHPTQLKKVTRLTVSGTDEKETFMTLCEVFAYGDCLAPSYGSHCDEICSIGCLDLTCYNNGECYDCLPRMKGTYCLEYNYTNEEMEEAEEDEPGVEGEDAVSVEKDHKPKVKDPFISGTDFLLMLMFSSVLPTTVVIFTIYIFCKICVEEERRKISVAADEYIPRKTMQSFRTEGRSATSLKSRKSSGGSGTTSTSTWTTTSVSKRLSFEV